MRRLLIVAVLFLNACSWRGVDKGQSLFIPRGVSLVSGGDHVWLYFCGPKHPSLLGYRFMVSPSLPVPWGKPKPALDPAHAIVRLEALCPGNKYPF